MLRKVCKAIELTGELRKAINEIDFKEIYTDELEGMKEKHAILEKEEGLTEIQGQLINIIGRAK